MKQWNGFAKTSVSGLDSRHEGADLSSSNGGHSSAENEVLPYELRDALVGLGIRKSYRAIFRVREDHIIVYRVVRAAEGTIDSASLE